MILCGGQVYLETRSWYLLSAKFLITHQLWLAFVHVFFSIKLHHARLEIVCSVTMKVLLFLFVTSLFLSLIVHQKLYKSLLQ